MNTQTMPKGKSLSKLFSKSQSFDRICQGLLFKVFNKLTIGRLEIEDQTYKSDLKIFGSPQSVLRARIVVKKSSFYSRTLFGGSIGNGESFTDGDWDCHELANLMRLFVLNRDVLESLDNGWASLLTPFQKLVHGLRSNTIKGSRENIRSHYDIGNDFFELFLDETMMYSSAKFEHIDVPLKDASIAKLEGLCRKLNLKSSDHLVEIGTGWGSLAIYAAQNFGCRVTTTTISEEQHDYAKQKIEALGLSDKITLLFEDYRNLVGKFDKLVSVEMIEAVGLENLNAYFAQCSSLLKPDGLMVIQGITIKDQYYESAKTSVDFIQRHIFPGGSLPSIEAVMKSTSKVTDLSLIHLEDFAEDYAHTLNSWALELKKNEQKILDLGYPVFLPRLWEYYFAYCEGGFRERAIGVSQFVFAKPQYRDRRLL